MGDLSRGLTFGAAETVTNTKLHQLVDDGSVSNIKNADIASDAAISADKIADITSGNKVSGKSLFNLASIPSGSGLIPYSNIPLGSLTSIPNSDLLPITTASWVSGRSFKDLASTPTNAGILPWQSIVTSLASGAVPKYAGGNTLIGEFLEVVPDVSTGSLTEAAIDTEVAKTNITSWDKVKEFSPSNRVGTYNVYFEMKRDGGVATVQARVYKNGVWVGSVTHSSTSSSYDAKNENVSIELGDVISLYTQNSASGTNSSFQNFRLRASNPLIPVGTDY